MVKIKQTTPAHDFVIPQVEGFIFQLKLYTGNNTDKQPLNITGYQFRCEVREEAGNYVFRYKANGEYIESTMPKESFESIYTIKGE